MASRSKTPPPTSTSRPGPKGPAPKPPCIGLSPAEITDLIERMDAPAPGARHSARRQTRRLEYRHWPVPMIMFPQHGSKTAVTVITRNISRGGLSFLHGSYVHVGLSVVAVLRDQRGMEVQIPAKVARCRHVERHIHEVGIQFNTPINVHDFLPIDHVGAQFSLEVTDPGMLRGKLLVVADYDIDRKLILHMLEGTKLNIVPVASKEEAKAASQKDCFDIVLSDYDLGDATGIDLFNDLKLCHSPARMIIMSSDVSGTTRTLVREAKCDAFLSKPFTKELLLSALAEFLLLGSISPHDGGSMISSLPPDSPLRGLAAKFVDETRKAAAELDAHMRDDRKDEFIRTASRLAGTASTLGFDALSQAAEQAIRAINASGSLRESGDKASALAAACRRIDAGVQAA